MQNARLDRKRRALLPDHVLWLARILESARQPYVRDPEDLLAFHGPESKAIVWAHNSHVGDAAATEMASRGEYNIGHLCRKEFGNRAYTRSASAPISGTVAAASDWDGPMEVKSVLPAHRGEL